jgi:antitoxin ParD1/3/4
MSAAEKISITLTPEMNRIIKQRVAAGDFASSSELIREALRVWQKREEEHQEHLASIRARIQNSIGDPRPSISLDEARIDFRGHVEARSKSIP